MGPAFVLTACALAVPTLLYASTLLAPPSSRTALEETADAASLAALTAYALDLESAEGGPATSVAASTGASGPVVLAALPAGPRTALPTGVAGAYAKAAEQANRRAPGCHLTWPLLAGIGLIESGHATGHGAGTPGWAGTATPPIIGPSLDGTAYADIADTDGGRLDGDRVHDRAVGPMQFLPSTWRRWGVDANGDGVADPQNLLDAAHAAGDYLCADGRDLAAPQGVIAAVFSYNHSLDYVRTVLTAAVGYSQGPSALTTALAGLPTPAPSPTPSAVPETVLAVPTPAAGPPVATTSRPASSPRPAPSQPSSPAPTVPAPEPTPPGTAATEPSPTPTPSADVPSATPSPVDSPVP